MGGQRFTGTAVACIEEVGGAVGVGEADPGRGLEEEEVGRCVPRELVEVQPRGGLVDPERPNLLRCPVRHRRATRTYSTDQRRVINKPITNLFPIMRR